MAKRLTTEQFIEKARKIHGDKYDYSLVIYKLSLKKVKIICPIHGIFEQIPKIHLKNSGCLKCNNKYSPTTKEIINKFKNIHGNKYDYSLVKYKKAHGKVKIICKKHGVFKQTPNKHTQHNGCPKCKRSKGEEKIELWLKRNNIKFNTQKSFDGCKIKRIFLFDFYLPKYNICIEYDGEQHFKPKKFYGGNKAFIKRQKYDKIKNKYCIDNNIKLIRISYKENIEQKLKAVFNESKI